MCIALNVLGLLSSVKNVQCNAISIILFEKQKNFILIANKKLSINIQRYIQLITLPTDTVQITMCKIERKFLSC